MKNNPDIAVLGDGAWGTTLAILLARKCFNVTLWGAFVKNTSYMNNKRVNKKFLPGIKIPKDIAITNDLNSAVKNKDLLVLAIPSAYMRGVLKRLKKIDYPRNAIYLSVTKGIEIGTLRRISEMIGSELGGVKLAALSGPTIAYEIARGLPAVAVIASRNMRVRKFLQDIFTTDRFRIYTNDDVIGVELGGA